MLKLNLQALKEEMMGDLNRYNIHLLREQGSRLGIKSVTTHNKEKLVGLIIEKKLQNHKSYEVDNAPESIAEISVADKERLMELHTNHDSEHCEIVSGILEINEGIDGFLRIYPHEQSSEDVFVPQAIINEYRLRYGDRIIGKTIRMKENEWRGIVDIISVGGHKSHTTRKNFSSLSACAATEKITLGASGNDLLKSIDEHSPIAKGQRSMLFCSSPLNLTPLIEDIIKALTANGIATTTLCLSERPETVAMLKTKFGSNIIATGHDVNVCENQRVAQLTLETLKREAESGKSVALIVTNIAILYGIENRRVLEKEFNYKTLFLSARNLLDSGNLTVLGFSFFMGNTGEQIYETLVPLSNSVIMLSASTTAPFKIAYDKGKSYSDFNIKE